VDTVVVGRQTASLPALAISAGKVRSPRPLRHQSHPFGEYPPKDLECAHRYPPTIDLAKYSIAATGGIDQNQITRRRDPKFLLTGRIAGRRRRKRVGYAELQCCLAEI
jgi:hypothetical protein